MKSKCDSWWWQDPETRHNSVEITLKFHKYLNAQNRNRITLDRTQITDSIHIYLHNTAKYERERSHVGAAILKPKIDS